MGKFAVYVLIMMFVANTCYALELELSDVIKEARKAEKLQLAKTKQKEESIQPVKNKTEQALAEKSVCNEVVPKTVLYEVPKK